MAWPPPTSINLLRPTPTADELRWTQMELRRISYIQLTAANPYPSTYAATLRLHRLAEEVIEAMRARLHHLEGLLNG